MLRFLIDGQLMTIEDYMARMGVSYLRAIHEVSTHVNQATIRSAAPKGAPGTPKRTAGDIGDAIDEGSKRHDEP
jgi:hypothetical protein